MTIPAYLEADLARLRLAMRAEVEAEVPLIADVGAHTLRGGKRLRAAVALLSARICGVEAETRIQVAAAIEFIHSATLLHDDVVDEAPRRRRHASANSVFGNAAAVLVGDFLYSRASQMLAATGSARMLARIADATNRLAEGEVLQLVGRGAAGFSKDDYLQIVERKTANLFQVAAAAGAILGGKSEWEAPLGEFGRRLGIGFQMIDDCLDYAADGTDTGKEPGRDFAEGKITLPLLCAMENARGEAAKILQTAVAAFGDCALFSFSPASTAANESGDKNGDGYGSGESGEGGGGYDGGDDGGKSDDGDMGGDGKRRLISFAEVAAIVRESGALEETRTAAAAEIKAACAALSLLPDGEDKQRLINIAQETASRRE
jgi:octaprenyl-diphosphate synthase